MEPNTFETLVSLTQQRALNHPDRNYVTFLQDGETQEASLSYGELDQAARQIAGWMQNNGLSKGERALLILPNGLEFTQLFYGCLYGGILAVPLAEPAGPHQMQAYLETFVPTLKTSKPKLLITTTPLADFLRNQLPSSLKDLFYELTIVTDQEILNETQFKYQAPDFHGNH